MPSRSRPIPIEHVPTRCAWPLGRAHNDTSYPRSRAHNPLTDAGMLGLALLLTWAAIGGLAWLVLP